MNYSLLQEIVDNRDRDLVLATIITSTGASPRHVGTQMLIYPDGSFYETVGGGINEYRVIEEARKLLKSKDSNLSRRLRFEMTNEEAARAGAICGGVMEVFLEVIKGNSEYSKK